MRKYVKQPLEIQEQIAVLKERGLIFLQEENAINKLKQVSYFRLANYWKPMEQDKVRHTFKPQSTFENALSLYYFDKELRNLLFTSIQTIEIALRTKMIHHISLQYGAFWFADNAIFTNQNIFNKCLDNLQNELKRSKEDFISEHYAKYDEPIYPPAWKTLEVSSFGTLSKLYCNLSDVKLKKQIAREFGLPQHIYIWKVGLKVFLYFEIVLLIMHVYGTVSFLGNHSCQRSYPLHGLTILLYSKKSYIPNFVVSIIC